MKNIIKTIAIATVVATGIVATSCEDMMTVDTGDKAYRNAQDTLYSYLGIMRAMQDIAERQVILGEIRGDLVTSTDYTTDTLYAISNFDYESSENLQDRSENPGSCSMLQVCDYYNVINNCNFYLHYADTNAVKSNVKYMLPEYAQVNAIRAWAYLQLVKNYKEVPYITKPIKNLNVIKDFDFKNNLVTKDNLVDRLLEDGLEKCIDTPYPQYDGKWNNGFTDISVSSLMIPVRVVLGDLYLLRGASTSDYEKAAQYYHDFLKKEEIPMYQQFCYAYNTHGNIHSGIVNGWGGWAQNYSSANEVVTLIPSSSNAGLGKMLTRVANIYGYATSSSQTSSTTETTDDNGDATTEKDANGNDVYEASGYISLTKTYKRQYAPSNAYQDIANKQTYVYYEGTGDNLAFKYIENCDARYENSIEDLKYEGDAYPLCCKAAKGAAFFYSIPIYRKSLIWLRLAEAINRAGYPEFAFAILKDGLNQYNLPKIVDRHPEVYDEGGLLVFYNKTDDTYLFKDVETGTYYEKDEEGSLVEVTPSATSIKNYTVMRETVENDSIAYATYGAMYYVRDKETIEKFNAFLDFTDDIWNETYGIHAKGAGYLKLYDGGKLTVWVSGDYENLTSIAGLYDTEYYEYYKLLEAQGLDANSTIDDRINAVENLIVDELALETAFEGNRFTDLVRIAEHKNASGYNGTEWLATKIANRGTKAATSTTEAVDGYNPDIYNKLTKNKDKAWYFSLPQ